MQENEEPSLFDQEINADVESAIIEIAKWSRYLSIIGFALGAFVVAIFLVAGSAVFKMVEGALPVPGLYGALVAVFFIFFFLAALVLYFLYKGATLLQQGITRQNNTLVAEGFNFLRYFFLASAIVSALGLFGNLSNFFN